MPAATGSGVTSSGLMAELLAKKTPKSNFAAKVTKRVLPNGLTVLVMPVPGSGTVSMTGKIRAGDYFSTAEKSMLADFTADMMTKGSTNLSKEALAKKLDLLGTSLDFATGDFWSSFSTDIVSEDFPTMLGLLAEVFENPLFAEDELARTKKITESEIKQRMVDTRAVSENLMTNALYKPGNPYYNKKFVDQLNELPLISAEDLRKFHHAQYVPANTVIAIVGDISVDKAISTVEASLGKLKAGAATKIEPPAVPAVEAARTIKTPIADKENVDTTIARPVDVSTTGADYFAAMIANSALGHSPFSTRLSPVREKYGYTYDIYSAFQNTAYGGAPWVIECSTNPENTTKAIDVIKKIVADYVDKGITQAEVKLEAKHLAGEFVVGLRTPSDIAEHLARYEMLGLSPKFMDEFATRLDAVTKAQADAAIRKYFRLDKAVTSIAGTVE